MVDGRHLDWAAVAFFLVALGIVLFAPWMEVYVEQKVEGVDHLLMTDQFGGLRAGSGVMAGLFAVVAAALVLARKERTGLLCGAISFFSGLFTYALLHSTLAAELAPERKQELVPGWGISAFLLWVGVALFLLFVHLWGERLWVLLCGAFGPVEARLTPEEQPPTSRATWVVALVLVVLMVVFLCSADPDDKIWKRMMR
jgi:MFS family permease